MAKGQQEDSEKGAPLMARKGGQDRGITQRKDRKGWWVRLYENGRQQWFKCDTKSQAKALYGRLKACLIYRILGTRLASTTRTGSNAP